MLLVIRKTLYCKSREMVAVQPTFTFFPFLYSSGPFVFSTFNEIIYFRHEAEYRILFKNDLII